MELRIKYTKEQQDIFFNCNELDRFIIVTKGRRFGATFGGLQFVIEEAIAGEPNLWGDTINSNIDRYFERIGKPLLIRNNIPFNYNSQQKKLTFPFSEGFVDFRSADRPENWEGFGYKNIILNEAGIILKNDYLYTNAVLPMMMDYNNSRLFAMGVPKGKRQRNNKEHKFYTLYLNAVAKKKGYRLLEYSSYDNSLLSRSDIEELEQEIGDMNPVMVQQEIYGKFVDESFDALWSPDMIQRVDKAPAFKRSVVAIDPTGTKTGDECGIISAGLGYDGMCYIISDRTGHYSPREWGTIAANEFQINNSDCYVAETNQGGEMVEFVIRQYDFVNRIKTVHAKQGKDLRAEPVVSMYERGLVKHLPGLNRLENEMLTWVPGAGKSPNRIDAMVYAVIELLINPLTQYNTTPVINNNRRI